MSVKKEQFEVQVPVQVSQMLINVSVRSRFSERFFISKNSNYYYKMENQLVDTN
jgi:hypothetical protein